MYDLYELCGVPCSALSCHLCVSIHLLLCTAALMCFPHFLSCPLTLKNCQKMRKTGTLKKHAVQHAVQHAVHVVRMFSPCASVAAIQAAGQQHLLLL